MRLGIIRGADDLLDVDGFELYGVSCPPPLLDDGLELDFCVLPMDGGDPLVDYLLGRLCGVDVYGVLVDVGLPLWHWGRLWPSAYGWLWGLGLYAWSVLGSEDPRGRICVGAG